MDDGRHSGRVEDERGRTDLDDLVMVREGVEPLRGSRSGGEGAKVAESPRLRGAEGRGSARRRGRGAARGGLY